MAHVSTKSREDAVLTDHGILTGKPELIIMDNLLRLAATHTNIEIAELVNAAQGKPVLTADVVRNRLCRSIGRIAKRDGRRRADVRAELDAAKAANGLPVRKANAPGAQVKRSAAENQSERALEEDGELDRNTMIPLEDNDAVESSISESNSDSGDSSDSDDLETQLRRAEVHGLFERDSPLMDDDVFQLATRYTLAEIVAHLNVGPAIPAHTSSSVDERIGKAVVALATRRHGLVKEVQEEMQELKAKHGVTERAVAERRGRQKARAQ